MAKLDLNGVWDRATKLLSRNRKLSVITAGVFLFLPLTALFLVLFGTDIGLPADGNEEDTAKAIEAFLGRYWWLLLLIGLGQTVGAIALIRILGDPNRPTVGEAIRSGVRLLLPLLAAQILAFLAIQSVPLLAELSGSPAITALVNLLWLPVAIYLSVKFLLVAPVVALENTANPVVAIKRSWLLTKGNSFRIFAFYALVVIAFVILAFVTMMVVGIVLALFGEQVETIGMAVLYAVLLTVFYLMSYAIMVAAYRQLAAPAASAAGVPKSGE